MDDEGITAVARHLLPRREERWPVGPSKTFLRQLAGDDGNSVRRFYSCSDCDASQYFLSITPTGYVVPCPLTFRQEPMLNGRDIGFAKAFEQLAQPTNSGCGCNPTTELNDLLSFRPEAIFNAFDLA